MKQGLSLTELAQEIERQAGAKKDYIADTRKLNVSVPYDGKEVELNMQVGKGSVRLPINNLAHDQLATKLEIPRKYYDRLRMKHPSLLETSINHLFENEPNKMMVRSLDGRARAFLSERYRPLDNFDLMQAILPVLQSVSGLRVESTAVTERKMYLKLVSTNISALVDENRPAFAGIVISNSELGFGRLSVEQMMWIEWCSNGATHGHSLKRNHVGRKQGHLELEDAVECFRDETRKQDDKAFFMKVQDVVKNSFEQFRIEELAMFYREAKQRKIVGDPVKAIEDVAEVYTLNQEEKTGVLTKLLGKYSLDQYGVANAITEYSQEVDSYERATEMESMGGQIIELNQNAWQELVGV